MTPEGEDALSAQSILERPETAIVLIEARMFGTTVDRWARCHGGLVIELTFRALPGLVGFDDERARVSVLPDTRVLTYPLGELRDWKHRNPSPMGPEFGHLAGDLCLFYPGDPRALRWEWADGFIAYLARVQRHLYFEEQWRRTGNWPVEDAPHGEPVHNAHPLETKFMRQEERRWARLVSSAS